MTHSGEWEERRQPKNERAVRAIVDDASPIAEAGSENFCVRFRSIHGAIIIEPVILGD
jgi:hypothetical protein